MSHDVEFIILGETRLRIGSSTWSNLGDYKRALEVLAYLAFMSPRPVPTDELRNAIWGRGNTNARKYQSQALWFLRKYLPAGHTRLVEMENSLVFDTSGIYIDLIRFRELVGLVANPVAKHAPLSDLEELVDMCKPSILPNVTNEWVLDLRNEVHEAGIRSYIRLAEIAHNGGHFSRVEEYLVEAGRLLTGSLAACEDYAQYCAARSKHQLLAAARSQMLTLAGSDQKKREAIDSIFERAPLECRRLFDFLDAQQPEDTTGKNSETPPDSVEVELVKQLNNARQLADQGYIAEPAKAFRQVISRAADSGLTHLRELAVLELITLEERSGDPFAAKELLNEMDELVNSVVQIDIKLECLRKKAKLLQTIEKHAESEQVITDLANKEMGLDPLADDIICSAQADLALRYAKSEQLVEAGSLAVRIQSYMSTRGRESDDLRGKELFIKVLCVAGYCYVLRRDMERLRDLVELARERATDEAYIRRLKSAFEAMGRVAEEKQSGDFKLECMIASARLDVLERRLTNRGYGVFHIAASDPTKTL